MALGLYFHRVRKGVFDLFEKPASGATDEQVLLATPAEQERHWTGPWMGGSCCTAVRASIRNRISGCCLFPGERKPLPIVQTRFDEIEGQFSPGWTLDCLRFE